VVDAGGDASVEEGAGIGVGFGARVGTKADVVVAALVLLGVEFLSLDNEVVLISFGTLVTFSKISGR